MFISKSVVLMFGLLIVVLYQISNVNAMDEVVVEYMSNSDLMIENAGEKLKFSRSHLSDVKSLYEKLVEAEVSTLLVSCRGYEGEWKTFFHHKLVKVIMVIYFSEGEFYQSKEPGLFGKVTIENSQFMVVEFDLMNEEKLTINSTLITRGASKVVAFALPKSFISITSNHDYLLISFDSNLTLDATKSKNMTLNGYIFCSELCIWERYRGGFPVSYNQFRSRYFSCHEDSLIEKNGFTAFRLSDDTMEQYQSQSFKIGEFDIYKEDRSIVYGKVNSLEECKRVYFRVCETYEVEISLLYDSNNEKCKYIFEKIEMKDNYVPCVLKMMIDLTGRGFYKVVETTMNFNGPVDLSLLGIRPKHYYITTSAAFIFFWCFFCFFYYIMKIRKNVRN